MNDLMIRQLYLNSYGRWVLYFTAKPTCLKLSCTWNANPSMAEQSIHSTDLALVVDHLVVKER